MIDPEFILNRHNSLQWCQASHEIAKYPPAYYDANGVYLGQEWSSFYDINKKNRRRVCSLSEYLEVEGNYIRTAIDVLNKEGIQYLTIGYLEKSTYHTTLFEEKISDRKELEVLFNECFIGMRVSIRNRKLVSLFKLCLREKMWCIFVNMTRNFELAFGYEYYLILHTEIPYNELREIVGKNHLYLDARTTTNL